MQTKKEVHSDAEWYFRQDIESDQYYNILFSLCRKFNIHWMTATEKEKAFIEEVTRINYEYDRIRRQGGNPLDIRPSFS